MQSAGVGVPGFTLRRTNDTVGLLYRQHRRCLSTTVLWCSDAKKTASTYPPIRIYKNDPGNGSSPKLVRYHWANIESGYASNCYQSSTASDMLSKCSWQLAESSIKLYEKGSKLGCGFEKYIFSSKQSFGGTTVPETSVSQLPVQIEPLVNWSIELREAQAGILSSGLWASTEHARRDVFKPRF